MSRFYGPCGNGAMEKAFACWASGWLQFLLSSQWKLYKLIQMTDLLGHRLVGSILNFSDQSGSRMSWNSNKKSGRTIYGEKPSSKYYDVGLQALNLPQRWNLPFMLALGPVALLVLFLVLVTLNSNNGLWNVWKFMFEVSMFHAPNLNKCIIYFTMPVSFYSE